MPVKTSKTLAELRDEASRIFTSIQGDSQFVRNRCVAGPCEYLRLVDLMSKLNTNIEAYNTLLTLPNVGSELVQYFQEEYADPTYNVGTQAAAMIAQAEIVRDEILTLLPKSNPGDYCLAQTISNYSLVDRTFSTAQTAAIVSEIDTLLALFE